MPDSRTVFDLRREGKLLEALSLAREVFAEAPGSPWSVRAYGWTLHDLMKQADSEGDRDRLRALYDEFSELSIDPGDEVLSNAAQRWCKRVLATPAQEKARELSRQGREASRNGQNELAQKLLRQAYETCSDDADIQTSYGWELERALSNCVRDEQPDANRVRQLLLEYGRLDQIERPGMLHSLVLAQAAKAAGKRAFSGFRRFLVWWDESHLRPDDFEQYRPGDGEQAYPSVVERVIKGLYKVAHDSGHKDDVACAVSFIGRHYTRYPEQEWFPYYYGQMLLKSGKTDEARGFVLPIVKRKMNEFWAWHTLGETYSGQDTERQIACYCRALACRVQDEHFLVNVHQDLGTVLPVQSSSAPLH